MICNQFDSLVHPLSDMTARMEVVHRPRRQLKALEVIDHHLLGEVADALLRTLPPLYTRHMAEAGVGSISEIFDGDPPHRPDGCIAQAWSVAESLRLLRTLQQAAPDVYARWEAGLRQGEC